MKLITKIISIVVVMLIVSTGLATVGIYNMVKIGESIRGIANSDVPLLNSITEITLIQLQQSIQLERALMSGELDDWEKFEKANDEFFLLEKKALRQFDVSNKLVVTAVQNSATKEQKQKYGKLHKKIGDIKTEYGVFIEATGELLTFVLNGNISSADINMPLVKKQVAGISAELSFLTAQISNSTTAAAVVAHQEEKNAEYLMITISFMAFLIVMVLGVWMLRSVNRQLGGDPSVLEDISESLANGDLSMDRDKDAIGVYGAINVTIDRLVEVIGGIKTGSDEVYDAAELVSEGNENLSQRTQEQATSLEEVASSMEEMTSVINQNAENAKISNQLTIEAREQAEKGVAVVSDAVAAVKEINESSNKIAEIISVIDDIAFQTNLLALNAAVEAARAGEQGRGFAVVASEVRNLAGRSASAAKEIKGLIRDSVEKVGRGAELVNASGESLEEIVTSVKKASVMVTEIAEASKEQAEGIESVNKTLTELDNITQQNATLVEEAAAASLFMGEQAQNLNDLVSYFNLGDQGAIVNTGEQNKLEMVNEEQEVLPSQSVTDNQMEQLSTQGNADWKDF